MAAKKETSRKVFFCFSIVDGEIDDYTIEYSLKNAQQWPLFIEIAGLVGGSKPGKCVGKVQLSQGE